MKCIFKKCDGECIGLMLTQDKDKWLALVNMVMKLGMCKVREMSSVPEKLFSSQELCYME